jgi:hypothetical protein
LTAGDGSQTAISTIVPIPVLSQLGMTGALPVAEPLPIKDAAPSAQVSFEFPVQEARSLLTGSVQASAATTTSIVREVRFYILRIVSFDPQGNRQEFPARDRDQIVLNPDPSGVVNFPSIEPFSLDKIPQLFGRLPDDRYALYLFEDGDERLIIQFVIRDGRPIADVLDVASPGVQMQDDVDGRDGAAPGEGPTDAVDEIDSPVAPDEAGASNPSLPSGPEGDAARATDAALGVMKPPLDRAPPEFAEWLGDAPLVSHAGLVLTAAAVGLATPGGCVQRVDRLMAWLGRGQRGGERRGEGVAHGSSMAESG